jgi:hypothetical protein
MHRINPQRTEIGGYLGGGLTEIAARKRSYAVGFFRVKKKSQSFCRLRRQTALGQSNQ